MPTFDDLIRQKPQTVQKSRGVISQVPEWRETNPYCDVVLEGVRRRFRVQQRPTLRGVKVLDRQPTFVDVVIGQSQGLDVVEKSAYDDWAGSDELDAIVAGYLDGLK